MAGRQITFQFAGFSGWDILWGLLPRGLQTRHVARVVTRDRGMTAQTLQEIPLYLTMPWATYRVLDERGKVQPCARERQPGL